MIKKLLSTIACGTLLFSLTGCGNNASTSTHKDKVATVKKTKKGNSKQNKSSKRESSSKNDLKTSTGVENSVVASSSSISSNKSNGKNSLESNTSSVQRQMSSQDAKNIVKEHIGNQLNNAGVSGKSANNLPSISEIDGYTAVQNGVNDWTVSGNGHTFHVTSTSVTGN